MVKNRKGQDLCINCNRNLPAMGELICGHCQAAQEREDEFASVLSLIRTKLLATTIGSTASPTHST